MEADSETIFPKALNAKKEDNFSLWFDQVIQLAEIVDTRYPVKGCWVWKEWGIRIYKNVENILRNIYEKYGHKPMQFPTFVRENSFGKESQFIKGFEDEVYWITRMGKENLGEGNNLILRPTSEVIIYPMFALWIRSWRDLPLKVYQNVNMFRTETKATKPLIRNRETIGFIEGHTAIAQEGSEKFFEEIVQMYTDIYNYFGLPFFFADIPKWDRFPGSIRTVDGYTLMADRKALELNTIGNLGTNFSREEVFNIEYIDKDGKKKHPYILCYGPSIDRIMAAIISFFGDDRGLVLSSDVTPLHAIIIPIIFEKEKEKIIEYCKEVRKQMEKLGLKVDIDDRDWINAGEKYNIWELKGVPLRIEIGPKEMKEDSLTIVRRDNLEKIKIKKSEVKQIKKILNDIDSQLRKKANCWFEAHNLFAKDYQVLKENIEKRKGVSSINWCGKQECADKIQNDLHVILVGNSIKDKRKGNCIICKEKSELLAYVAKKY